MSTQTAQNAGTSASMNETLEGRIDETSRLVRKVDFSLSILTLLSIVFGVLFLAIVADHWLFAEGLSTGMRLALFVGLVFVVAFYVYRRIVPLFLYPINPVYAARVLEESAPSLKNSIINWILLRREQLERGGKTDKLSERMFDGVTRSAATGVNEIPSERAVDLRGIARWGIVLTSLFLFFVGYGIFSPKSPMTSLARIMLPWSDIRTPQEIRFLDVEPGNAVALQGERLTVSAELVGKTVGKEPVYVFFSTDDGQAVRQAVPMTQPEGKTRYEAPFPPGKQGFVSGVDYWLQQGDSRSPKFRIDVRPIASIEITSLTYQYPAYTGLDEEIVETGGDIRGVEGTEVKIAVRSTMPLQRIDLVMDNDPAKTVAMKLNGENTAATTLTLRHHPESTTPTTRSSYSFRAVDSEGYESRRSGVFRIEVLPDRPPMVQWSDTDAELAEKLKNADELVVPLNASLELPVQAEDPDFGLRYLRFHVESGNKRIRHVDMIESPAAGPTKHIGPIRAATVFSPVTSRLAEGDTAEIWIEAVDTKLPEPNTATTRKITVRVGSPQQQEEQQKKEESKEEKKDGKEDKEKDKDKDQGDQEKENDQKKDDDNADPSADDENAEKTQDDPNAEADNKDGNDSGMKDPKDGGKEEGETGKTEKDDEQNDETERKSGEPDKNKEDESGDRQQDEEKGKPSGNEQDGKEDSSDGSDKKQGQDKQNGDKQQGADGQQKQDPSKDGEKKPVDPNTQDGDAMERILEQMKKENKLPDNTGQDPGQDSKQDSKPEQQGDKDPSKDDKSEEKQDQRQDQRQDQKGPQQDQEQQKQEQKKKSCENGDCKESDCEKCNGGGGQGEKKDGESGQGGQGGQSGEQDQSDGSKEGGGQESSKDSSQGGDDGGSDGSADGTEETDKQGNQAGKTDSGSKDGSEGDAQKSDKSGDGEQQSGGGGGEQSPDKKSGGDSTSGGGGQGDKNSDPSQQKNNNSGNDGEDIPVDPNDNAPRERDRSLDPNSKDRKSQGGDSTEPKKSDQTVKDMPDNTTTTGDTGKGQETRQQGSSERTQSAEDGDIKGEKGTDGVEQEGGDQGGKQEGGRQQEKQGGEQESPGGSEGQQGEQGEQGSKSDSPSQGGEGQQSEQGGNSSPGESNETGDPSQSGGTVGPGGGGGKSDRPDMLTPKDEANLEYSEKVTNLVLEYLEDQLKDTPNQELLDKLGWTEEDLRNFHRKWKEMAEQGRKPEQQVEGADEAWKEALKSLGLRPSRERQEQRRSHSEFNDAGSSAESLRYAPPKALQKRWQRYNENIGTGGKRE